jgi:hypothetical protein
MRSIITQPVYRALKTLAERKSAFNTYIEQETRREKVNNLACTHYNKSSNAIIFFL